MKQTILAILISVIIPVAAFSSEGGEESEGATNFGEGKAVTAFGKEEGFKLSQKAMQNLGVEFSTVKTDGPWTVPSGAIVHLKQSSGVYRKVDGWISFVLVKVVNKAGATVSIQSADLQAGDEVAIRGATFLRMTDADLNAGTVDSCAH